MIFCLFHIISVFVPNDRKGLPLLCKTERMNWKRQIRKNEMKWISFESNHLFSSFSLYPSICILNRISNNIASVNNFQFGCAVMHLCFLFVMTFNDRWSLFIAIINGDCLLVWRSEYHIIFPFAYLLTWLLQRFDRAG